MLAQLPVQDDWNDGDFDFDAEEEDRFARSGSLKSSNDLPEKSQERYFERRSMRKVSFQDAGKGKRKEKRIENDFSFASFANTSPLVSTEALSGIGIVATPPARQTDTSSALALSSTIRQTLEMTKANTMQLAHSAFTAANVYMIKYPALKTFVYATAGLSLAPVGIFSLCVGVSLCVSIFTAVAGVVMVQSGVILVGLSILVPVEAGVLMLAGSLAAAANMTGWDRYLWLEKNGNRQKSLQGQPHHFLSSSSTDSGSVYQNLLLQEQSALHSMESRIQPFDENTTIIH